MRAVYHKHQHPLFSVVRQRTSIVTLLSIRLLIGQQPMKLLVGVLVIHLRCFAVCTTSSKRQSKNRT